jgi:NAD(P)H-dependent FMN reductase
MKADHGPVEGVVTIPRTEEPTVSNPASQTRVVVLVGSLRADSLNRRIAETLRDNAPEGVSVEIAEGLGEIPFYNEELDHDQAPAAAQRLRDLVAGADRVLAVTPEYNGTMPAVLNNAIDWLSRPYGVGAITGKPFAVVGATPTPYGGKWSHDDARRSAGIAGAVVRADIVVSQPALEGDILADPQVVDTLLGALRSLAQEPVAA